MKAGSHAAGLRASNEVPVLACLSCAMLLSSLGTSIANVGLPTLAQAFGATFGQVQWVVIAYLLAITTLVVSVGRLGDLAGRRRLLLAGIGLYSAASLLCGLAPSLGLLVAARAAQGLGAAVMMTLAMAFVGQSVPKARTGSAMGLLGTMSAIGTALGPPLGGVLIAGFGWRAIFLVSVPLGILAFVLALRGLPADRRDTMAARARFDHLGTLLLGLRNAALRANLAMSALVATVMMATLVVGPFYLSRAFGLDAALVGLVLLAGPAGAALSGVPAGRLADRYGTQRMTVAGLVVMAAGALALAVMPLGFGLAGYVVPTVVIAIGYALFQAANNSAVMADAAPEQRGAVAGILNLSRNLGLVSGTAAMGAVFALGAGTADIMTASPAAVGAGMHATFAVAAGLLAAALAIARAGK